MKKTCGRILYALLILLLTAQTTPQAAFGVPDALSGGIVLPAGARPAGVLYAQARSNAVDATVDSLI